LQKKCNKKYLLVKKERRMKKNILVLVVFVLFMVAGLISCTDPSSEVLTPEQLRISNVPVTSSFSYTVTDFAYAPYNRAPLSNTISGIPKVEVTNGKLTVELDAPKATALYNYTVPWLFPECTVTPANAKFNQIFFFFFNEPSVALDLRTGYDKEVSLISTYINVTVNGSSDMGGVPVTFNNISLKAGWNFVIAEYNYSTSVRNFLSATQTMPSGLNGVLVHYQ
jgi:hypothetical protein